jgi:hypothetical protein
VLIQCDLVLVRTRLNALQSCSQIFVEPFGHGSLTCRKHWIILTAALHDLAGAWSPVLLSLSLHIYMLVSLQKLVIYKMNYVSNESIPPPNCTISPNEKSLDPTWILLAMNPFVHPISPVAKTVDPEWTMFEKYPIHTISPDENNLNSY